MYSGEDAVMIAETTTKDFEYYTKVDKVAAGLERADPSIERSATVGKMLSNSIAATEKLFMNARADRCGKLHCHLI